MSPLASAPGGAAHASAPVSDSVHLGGVRVSTDAVLGLCLAVGLSVIAFVTTGGVDLNPNTWTEIVLILLGAAVAIVLMLIGARGRAWGAVTFTLFVALAVLTAISITWSVQPDVSWVEAGRTLSYLAVFGSSLALARMFPGRWATVLGAVAVGASAICAYALLVKVFPATLDRNETFGRLRAPFDYWNATGLIAAIALPPCLWAGARRTRALPVAALAFPAVAILITVIVFSYSRGAVLVAIAGIAVWFALVPLRLRGAVVLLVGGLGGAAASLYVLGTHALTANQVPLAARTSAGHSFGLVLLAMLAALSVAGFATVRAMDRVHPSAAARQRIGLALIVAVALVPVGGIAALAASQRGLTGEVSHVWHTLTSSSLHVGNGPARLVQLGNSRGRYWHEGIKVGDHALLHGVGAGGYGTAVTRYTSDPRTVAHAHSYAVQTFADFGLIGVALMIAMLASWCVAAWRTLAPGRSRDGETAEREGLLTMLAVVVIFGLHSAIDWTWFVPGTALPALICAGWLAGRGPVAERVGTRPRPALAKVPGIAAAGLALLTATVFACWAVWQPLGAADASSSGLNAAASGHLSAAIADFTTAANRDPVAVDPLFELAATWSAAGNPPRARAALLQAVDRQPENALTWQRLGEFDLRRHHPRLALASLRRARTLNLSSPQIGQDLAQAQAALKPSA